MSVRMEHDIKDLSPAEAAPEQESYLAPWRHGP
jgi:hypothetical protein